MSDQWASDEEMLDDRAKKKSPTLQPVEESSSESSDESEQDTRAPSRRAAASPSRRSPSPEKRGAPRGQQAERRSPLPEEEQGELQARAEVRRQNVMDKAWADDLDAWEAEQGKMEMYDCADPAAKDPLMTQRLLQSQYSQSVFRECVTTDEVAVAQFTRDRQLRRLPLKTFEYHEGDWDADMHEYWLKCEDETVLKKYRTREGEPIHMDMEWHHAVGGIQQEARMMIDGHTMRQIGTPTSIDGIDQVHPSAMMPLSSSLLVSPLLAVAFIHDHALAKMEDGFDKELPWRSWSEPEKKREIFHMPVDPDTKRRIVGFVFATPAGVVTFVKAGPLKGVDACPEMINVLLGQTCEEDAQTGVQERILITFGDEDEDEIFFQNFGVHLPKSRIRASAYLTSLFRGTRHPILLTSLFKTLLTGASDVHRMQTAPDVLFAADIFSADLLYKYRTHLVRNLAYHAMGLVDSVFVHVWGFEVTEKFAHSKWPDSLSRDARHIQEWKIKLEKLQLHLYPFGRGYPGLPIVYTSCNDRHRMASQRSWIRLLERYRVRCESVGWQAAKRPADATHTMGTLADALMQLKDVVIDFARVVAPDADYMYSKTANILAYARLWTEERNYEALEINPERWAQWYRFHALAPFSRRPRAVQMQYFLTEHREYADKADYFNTLEHSITRIKQLEKTMPMRGWPSTVKLMQVPPQDEMRGPVMAYLVHGTFMHNPALPLTVHPEWEYVADNLYERYPQADAVALARFNETFGSVPEDGRCYPGKVAPALPLYPPGAHEAFDTLPYIKRYINDAPFNGRWRFGMYTRPLQGRYVTSLPDILPTGDFDASRHTYPSLPGMPQPRFVLEAVRPFHNKLLTAPGWICFPVTKPMTYDERVTIDYLHARILEEHRQAIASESKEELNNLIKQRLAEEAHLAGGMMVRILWLNMAATGAHWIPTPGVWAQLLDPRHYEEYTMRKLIRQVLRWHGLSQWSDPPYGYNETVKWMLERADTFAATILSHMKTSGRTIGDVTALEGWSVEAACNLVLPPDVQLKINDPQLFAPYRRGLKTSATAKLEFRRLIVDVQGATQQVEAFSKNLATLQRATNDCQMKLTMVRNEAALVAYRMAFTPIPESFVTTGLGVRRLIASVMRRSGTHSTISSMHLNPETLQAMRLPIRAISDPVALERALYAALTGGTVDERAVEVAFAALFSMTGHGRAEWHTWAADMIERIFNEYQRGDDQEPKIYSTFTRPPLDDSSSRDSGAAPVIAQTGEMRGHTTLWCAYRLNPRYSRNTVMTQWGPMMDDTYDGSKWLPPKMEIVRPLPFYPGAPPHVIATPLPRVPRPYMALQENRRDGRMQGGATRSSTSRSAISSHSVYEQAQGEAMDTMAQGMTTPTDDQATSSALPTTPSYTMTLDPTHNLPVYITTSGASLRAAKSSSETVGRRFGDLTVKEKEEEMDSKTREVFGEPVEDDEDDEEETVHDEVDMEMRMLRWTELMELAQTWTKKQVRKGIKKYNWPAIVIDFALPDDPNISIVNLSDEEEEEKVTKPPEKPHHTTLMEGVVPDGSTVRTLHITTQEADARRARMLRQELRKLADRQARFGGTPVYRSPSNKTMKGVADSQANGPMEQATDTPSEKAQAALQAQHQEVVDRWAKQIDEEKKKEAEDLNTLKKAAREKKQERLDEYAKKTSSRERKEVADNEAIVRKRKESGERKREEQGHATASQPSSSRARHQSPEKRQPRERRRSPSRHTEKRKHQRQEPSQGTSSGRHHKKSTKEDRSGSRRSTEHSSPPLKRDK